MPHWSSWDDTSRRAKATGPLGRRPSAVGVVPGRADEWSGDVRCSGRRWSRGAPRALAAAGVDGVDRSSMLSSAGLTGATADQVTSAPTPMICSSRWLGDVAGRVGVRQGGDHDRCGKGDLDLARDDVRGDRPDDRQPIGSADGDDGVRRVQGDGGHRLGRQRSSRSRWRCRSTTASAARAPGRVSAMRLPSAATGRSTTASSTPRARTVSAVGVAVKPTGRADREVQGDAGAAGRVRSGIGGAGLEDQRRVDGVRPEAVSLPGPTLQGGQAHQARRREGQDGARQSHRARRRSASWTSSPAVSPTATAQASTGSGKVLGVADPSATIGNSTPPVTSGAEPDTANSVEADPVGGERGRRRACRAPPRTASGARGGWPGRRPGESVTVWP